MKKMLEQERKSNEIFTKLTDELSMMSAHCSRITSLKEKLFEGIDYGEENEKECEKALEGMTRLIKIMEESVKLNHKLNEQLDEMGKLFEKSTPEKVKEKMPKMMALMEEWKPTMKLMEEVRTSDNEVTKRMIEMTEKELNVLKG